MSTKGQRVFCKKKKKSIIVPNWFLYLQFYFHFWFVFYLVKTASGSGEQVKTPVKLPDYGKTV